jgi:23S rRNA (guanosine2251-2'-O)-methyltransferase
MTKNIVVIAHDIRSTHNVGSLFRTCEGLGVSKLYLTGYSPYPLTQNEKRLPHLARKIDSQIQKTALGAEKHLPWEASDSLDDIVSMLIHEGYEIVAVEQTKASIPISDFIPNGKLALLFGNEVTGLQKKELKFADTQIEIPMRGRKESFNIVVAAAIAIYHCSTS